MSTITLAAPRVPRTRRAGFGRWVRALLTVVDVVAEAHRLAAEAHRRFPFGRW